MRGAIVGLPFVKQGGESDHGTFLDGYLSRLMPMGQRSFHRKAEARIKASLSSTGWFIYIFVFEFKKNLSSDFENF